MFQYLANLTIRKYKHILILSLILFVVTLLISKNLGMDSNMEGMLPESSASLQASKEFEQYFESQENVMVVVQGNSYNSEQFLESLYNKIESDKTVHNALYKINLEDLENYSHLFLDKDLYEELESELNNPNSLLSQFLRKKDLHSLSQLFLERYNQLDDDKKKITFYDSFTTLMFTNEKLPESKIEDLFLTLLWGSSIDVSSKSQFIVSEDHSTYLMMIKPSLSMDNIVEARTNFFTSLEKAIEETLKEGDYAIKVGITGGAFVQDYEADEAMFQGFTSTALLTFILIIVFVIFSFRRITLPLATGYPLLLGAMLSTTFAYLVYKKLNMFSISFAVILLGLGIDFGVHILSRYLEEKNTHSVKEAVILAVKKTGPGIIVGAFTTASVFITFYFAEFKAFTQMGVISGVGILLLGITMLLIIPASIVAIDNKGKLVKKNLKSNRLAILNRVGEVVEKRSRWVLVIVGILVALVISNVYSSKIETDMSMLYPENMESLQWIEVVEEKFDYNPTSLLFMVDNITELQNAVSKLKDREEVKEVQSILDYLPEDQSYKLSVIQKWNSSLTTEANPQIAPSPEELITTLNRVKGLTNIEPKIIDQIEFLIAGLQSDHPEVIMDILKERSSEINLNEFKLSTKVLKIHDLPEGIKRNFIGKEGKLSVEVIPETNIWKKENYEQIKSLVEEYSGRSPVGMPAIMNEVTVYAKKDMINISLVSILVLFVILILLFKTVRDALIITISLLITIYLTLGILPIIGAELNIFSIIAFPVVIGIGVDSAVHLLHRIKTSPDQGIPYILSTTGKAIVITTVTTFIGFGSLTFINHPGLSSFGLVTITGMAVCLFITLTVLPALYLAFYSKQPIVQDQSFEKLNLS
ncbi:efflux RND transporter permease subunit [Bacillus salinus]|uniref:efflux RND transporter permease subunit n=1 Tax=Bacillus sp. HMF5848 TaxID=2495421 RepID=UPI00163A4897|nr:MMPL family transporter [Bacillus sp. HMF5848]